MSTRTQIPLYIALFHLFASAGSAQWTEVARRLIQTAPESYPYDWGEGVQMIGLMKAFEVTHNPAYADYVAKWAAIYAPKNKIELLGLNTERSGYCGHWSPATALLYLYQAGHSPDHLRMAEMSVNFIRDGAERSPEGGLGHWQGSHQMWVDTLYMACPLLAGMGRVANQPALIQDAASQIIIFSRHLQDEKSGLFFHMWDWQSETRSEGFWGRGNGWVLMSLADTMEAMKPGDSNYHELEQIARKMVRGIEKTQDGAGLWHTVLDDESSYAECSATAMFVYGLHKLTRLHVLTDGNRAVALRAWKAINERYVQNGLVTGVSGGTGPRGIASYRSVPLGTYTWGTGAYLMAAAEVSSSGERSKR